MRIRCESLASRVRRGAFARRLAYTLAYTFARTLTYGVFIVAGLAACGGSTSDSVAPHSGGDVAITITPSAPSITVGAQLALQAQAHDASGKLIPGATIFWSSADSGIVGVSSAGVVTGRSVGTTQIAASSSGASAVVAVTVLPVAVASIAVLPSAATLVVGGTVDLQAVAYDADAQALNGRTAVWATTAPQVATVDGSGKVTAIAAGKATITGTVENKTASAEITVTVISVAAVAVSPSSATLDVGQSKALSAVTTDANGNTLSGRPITWSSAKASIATVSAAGLVTAVGAGTTTISATAEGKSDNAQIVVTDTAPPPLIPVASVVVAPGTASLNIGGTVTLSVTLRDANGATLAGRSITWSTSAASVATVSSSGVVTAIAPGSAIIKATCEGKSDSATVTVQPVAPAPVDSVIVSPVGATVDSGKTVTFTATTRDGAGNILPGRTITWKSSSPSIASIDATTGVVTGQSLGSTAITATSEGKNTSAVVTVRRVPVATVTPSSASLHVGDVATLTAVTKDADGNVLTGRTVTWSSGTTSVATINENSGLVTAIAAGSSTITATSEGNTGNSTVTVTPVPVASVIVAPTTAALTVGQTKSFSDTTKDANGNVLTGRAVAWSSGTPSVATVDPTSGLVTAIDSGSTTITATATSEGKSASATVMVTLVPVDSVSVTAASPTVGVGLTDQLSAAALDADGKTLSGRAVSWSSGDPTIATVDSNGLVTANATGSVTIHATIDRIDGSISVTVTP